MGTISRGDLGDVTIRATTTCGQNEPCDPQQNCSPDHCSLLQVSARFQRQGVAESEQTAVDPNSPILLPRVPEKSAPAAHAPGAAPQSGWCPLPAALPRLRCKSVAAQGFRKSALP